MNDCRFFKLLLILFCIFSYNTGAQIITTIAGNGTGAGSFVAGYGGDGGPATLAELAFPRRVAVDRYHNILIADVDNNRIRCVNSTGVITTVAGTGIPLFISDGEQATTTQISVISFALDSIGNTYIEDNSNSRIRKISTSGIVTTVAGNGISGNTGDGGQATAAEINSVDITCDRQGNLYLASIISGNIRKINKNTGNITTIAGTGASGFSGDGGAASAAQFNYPKSIAIDDSGNIYIGESYRIRKINTLGIVSTIVGDGAYSVSGDGGPAAIAEIKLPEQIAFDRSNNLYFADEANYRIRKINNTGIITTIAGNGTYDYTGDGGPATMATLRNPRGVAVDDTGNVYIADEGNQVIRKVTFPDYPPHFTGGPTQAFAVCENTTGNAINSLLTVIDSNTDDVERWSVVTAPVHGSVAAVYKAISADSIFTTSGMFYTPTAGYGGNDSFKVRVTDGLFSDTTMVHVTISPLLSSVTGPAIVCQYAAITLSNATTGGAWSTLNTAIATVGAASGTVTGIAAGTAIITYSAPVSCGATVAVKTITVNLSPVAITGTTTLCSGIATTLSDVTTDGTWSSSNTALATVSPAGMVSGIFPGTSIITYKLSTGCATAATVTVNTLPVPIGGPHSVCAGSAITLIDATTGGTWSSGNTAVASVVPIAIGTVSVTGISPGTAAIAYTLGTGCMRTVTVTVNGTAAISSPANVCIGVAAPLTDATSGGAWHSSNTAVVTVNAATGAAMGIIQDTATISYGIAATGCATSTVVTVSPSPAAIAGTAPAAGLCIGASLTLTDFTTGGVWGSSNTAVAILSGTMGVVTGLSAGTVTISYTLPTGCSASRTVTVSAFHVPPPLGGASTVCAGATATLRCGYGRRLEQQHGPGHRWHGRYRHRGIDRCRYHYLYTG